MGTALNYLLIALPIVATLIVLALVARDYYRSKAIALYAAEIDRLQAARIARDSAIAPRFRININGPVA